MTTLPQFIVLLCVLGVLCGENQAFTPKGMRLRHTESVRNDKPYPSLWLFSAAFDLPLRTLRTLRLAAFDLSL